MRPNLTTLFDDLRRLGRDTAVVRHTGNRRRVTTYNEIAILAGRFATLLAERGIGPGDRVLLWAENSAQWIAAFYGCMLRGVLVVPLDSYGTPDFATKVAADVRPSLVVGDAVLLAHRLPFPLPLECRSSTASSSSAPATPPSSLTMSTNRSFEDFGRSGSAGAGNV